jgi:hypothetical protein
MQVAASLSSIRSHVPFRTGCERHLVSRPAPADFSSFRVRLAVAISNPSPAEMAWLLWKVVNNRKFGWLPGYSADLQCSCIMWCINVRACMHASMCVVYVPCAGTVCACMHLRHRKVQSQSFVRSVAFRLLASHWQRRLARTIYLRVTVHVAHTRLHLFYPNARTRPARCSAPEDTGRLP